MITVNVLLCHVMLIISSIYLFVTCHVMSCHILHVHCYMSHHAPCIEYVMQKYFQVCGAFFFFIMIPSARMCYYPSGTPFFTLECLNWCEISWVDKVLTTGFE